MRQGGVGARGVRDSSSSSSTSSSSDSEPETNVQNSSSLISKRTTTSPRSSDPEISKETKQKNTRLGDRLLNSELKMVKCDINVSDHNKVVKDIVKEVKPFMKSDCTESRKSVPLRSATNHDRCKSAVVNFSQESDPYQTKRDEPKSQNLTTPTSSTPLFSNLYKSTTLDSFSSPPFPSASKAATIPSTPRTTNLTKTSSSSTGKVTLKPGGNMSSMISSLSNSYLSKSPLSSNTPLSLNRNEKSNNQSVSTESKEKPWGFAAAAAQKQTEVFGLDKSGFPPTLSSFMNTRKTLTTTSTIGPPLNPMLCSPLSPSLGSTLNTPLGTSLQTSLGSKLSPLGPSLKNPLGSISNRPIGSTLNPIMTSSIIKGVQHPGFGQLKGLFDGLSHLFATPAHSRFRTGVNTPNYNPGRRKPRKELPKRKHKTVTNDIRAVKKVPRTGIFPLLEEVKKSPVVPPQTLSSQQIPTTNYFSPSFLVKAAVNAKKHETERRRIFKEEGPNIVSDSFMRLQEKQALKRELIAEATQAHHHPNRHPVPPIPPQTVRPAIRSGKKLPAPPLPPACLA